MKDLINQEWVAVLHALQMPMVKACQSENQIFLFWHQIVSFTCEEIFFLCVTPMMIWCIHYGLGVIFLRLTLISLLLNTFIKFSLTWPRPHNFHNFDATFTSIANYGFPSGHSQMSILLAGLIFPHIITNKRWLYGAITIYALLVGWSRIALDAHFFTDVFGGWLIGLLIIYFHRKSISIPITVHSHTTILLLILFSFYFNPALVTSVIFHKILGGLVALLLIKVDNRTLLGTKPLYQNVMLYIVGICFLLVIHSILSLMELESWHPSFLFCKYLFITWFIVIGFPKLVQNFQFQFFKEKLSV